MGTAARRTALIAASLAAGLGAALPAWADGHGYPPTVQADAYWSESSQGRTYQGAAYQGATYQGGRSSSESAWSDEQDQAPPPAAEAGDDLPLLFFLDGGVGPYVLDYGYGGGGGGYGRGFGSGSGLAGAHAGAAARVSVNVSAHAYAYAGFHGRGGGGHWGGHAGGHGCGCK